MEEEVGEIINCKGMHSCFVAVAAYYSTRLVINCVYYLSGV